MSAVIILLKTDRQTDDYAAEKKMFKPVVLLVSQPGQAGLLAGFIGILSTFYLSHVGGPAYTI